jgi:small conductance mechanosensitive channel
MDEVWRHFADQAENYAGRLVGAIVILVVGWYVLRLLLGPLQRLLERSRFDPSMASFLTSSVRAAILLVMFLAVLQQLGVQTASLLTLMGAVGIAIGLALQNALANFASGLIVLSFRMVRLGDQIEVGDFRGQVIEMLPFHIVLITADNQRITLPNTMLTNGPIRNNSTMPIRRVQWSLPVSVSTDLSRARESLLACLQADQRVLSEPAPQVYVQEGGLDKLLLAVVAWTTTESYVKVQTEMLEQLWKSLEPVRQQEKKE